MPPSAITTIGDELSIALENGSLQRNFMGYTIHADCELLGLGVSAISHVGDSFSQNHRDLSAYQEQIDAGHLPLWRGIELGEDDHIRAAVIHSLMCRNDIDIAALEDRFEITFSEYFASAELALQQLESDGLLTRDAGHIVPTARGRLLLRVIAACFDAYLKQPDARGQFST